MSHKTSIITHWSKSCNKGTASVAVWGEIFVYLSVLFLFSLVSASLTHATYLCGFCRRDHKRCVRRSSGEALASSFWATPCPLHPFCSLVHFPSVSRRGCGDREGEAAPLLGTTLPIQVPVLSHQESFGQLSGDSRSFIILFHLLEHWLLWLHDIQPVGYSKRQDTFDMWRNSCCITGVQPSGWKSNKITHIIQD